MERMGNQPLECFISREQSCFVLEATSGNHQDPRGGGGAFLSSGVSLALLIPASTR